MHGVDACMVHQVKNTMIKSFKRSERKVEPFICEQLLRNVLQPLGHNQTHTSINLEHFSVSTRTANGTLRNFTVPREDPYNNLDLFFLKDTMFNMRLITVNRSETGPLIHKDVWFQRLQTKLPTNIHLHVPISHTIFKHPLSIVSSVLIGT